MLALRGQFGEPLRLLRGRDTGAPLRDAGGRRGFGDRGLPVAGQDFDGQALVTQASVCVGASRAP